MRLWPGVLLCASAAFGPPAVAAPGLVGTDGTTRIVRAVPHMFLAEGEAFGPHLAAGAMVSWAGDLSILRAGSYRFFVTGGLLRLDGNPVGSEPLHLAAGQHRFALSAVQSSGPARLLVEWSGPGFAREPVPGRLLSHTATEASGPDGRMLFEDLGCANCHRSGSRSIQGRPGPPLTGLASRAREAWIGNWLDAPERFRAWATMPQLLDSAGRADVAAFLAVQRTGVPAFLALQRIVAPAFRALQRIAEPRYSNRHAEHGMSIFQSIGCAACHAADLPLSGLGSKATVGQLQRYLLDPLHFSPAGRMPALHLSEEEALSLAAFLGGDRDEDFERPPRAGDPFRGRDLVRTSGCLACHSLAGLDSAHGAPPLAGLNAAHGCLAEDVPAGVPRYRLSTAQRTALRRFVADYRSTPDNSAAPVFDLERRLAQLRCNACHELQGAPPSGALAERAPPLAGVGRKLRAAWTERVIGTSTRVLNWQELRMPSYGPTQARWLASALAKASGIDPEADETTLAQGDPHTGLALLGMDGAQGGLGCIGCHGWGGFPSLGENGPNLRSVGERLRADWFQRWMRGPARIVPGTSMPNYFGGEPSGASRQRLADLWAAFRAAEGLPPPAGFVAARAEIGSEEMPVATDRAVVVRWDMPEATPAAIAVGLPGGVSYCFDAGAVRLRYAWLGGFVDLSPVLHHKKNKETNRTETARIVGDVFFREGPYPFRVGHREQIPQRRFRGYRLLDSVPEFHYEVDGVEIRELIQPIAGGIVRRFRIARVSEPMWFVAPSHPGVRMRSTLPSSAIPLGTDVAFEVSLVARR